MKKYTAPKFEILEIELEDVLKQSGSLDMVENKNEDSFDWSVQSVNDSDFSND